jgi:hypothetical protein
MKIEGENAMNKRKIDQSRRDFLRQAVSVGGVAMTTAGVTTSTLANRHPHPHETSLDYLDRNTYIDKMEVHGHFVANNDNPLIGAAPKANMMAIGEQRFLFKGGFVWDITDPVNAHVINAGGFRTFQLQLAYNHKLGKWILMTGHSAPITSSHPNAPNGKYDDPSLIESSINAPGLRGIKLWDATDPSDLKLLSEWSCDQGDPGRTIQTGAGTHRDYYDGGKYAYLDTAPDNSFIRMEAPWRHYSNCLQIIDVENPEEPKFVSNWWFPGQRAGEEAAYRRWREYGDRSSWTSTHGAFYVPVKVENGGRYCYNSYGCFGNTIHDLSDPGNPKLVSRWRPPYMPGAIPMHTTDCAWLASRGFVVTSSEALNPDCFEPYHDNYIIDVRDPKNQKVLSTLPRWVPPEEAPYDSFCDKRGRYGTHNPPHLKAPGKVNPNFTVYAAFNAGIQAMDISDPANPRPNGYFIPPMGGELTDYASWNRTGEDVFVEWDRNLIWAGTDTGMYLLSHPDLGRPILKPRRVTEWTLDRLNEGHDD